MQAGAVGRERAALAKCGGWARLLEDYLGKCGVGGAARVAGHKNAEGGLGEEAGRWVQLERVARRANTRGR